jgi:ribonucleoside-triphosphate reductase
MVPSHEGRAIAGGNQLELWAAPAAELAPGLCVLRRDGREAAFDVEALSNSILRAGWPGEALDGDTALSLARAVGLFLQHSAATPVPVETLRHTVERLLLDMGYALTARMYAGAFAPVSQPPMDGDGAAGMFEEALALDRAERSLVALAADAGLDRDAAEDVLAEMLRQIRAAGLPRLTPPLLREWMRSELHTRGLGAAAAKIARLTLPVSALHDAFADGGQASSAVPADPESAALALAGRVSAAYVLGQLMPSITGQAHLRGDIHVRGVGDFVRLDSILLDLEGLKDQGVLAPGTAGAGPRAETPEVLATQLTTQNDVFMRYFGGQIGWSAINFGFAPLLEGRTDEELTTFARNLLANAPERPARRASVEYRLAWDVPENYPADLAGAHGVRTPLGEVFNTARRLLGAALETLCDLSEKGWPVPSARMAIHLSPYFFGAPEAERYLELIGRVALGALPIVLRYEAAAPMIFEESAIRGRAQVAAQTVCIPVARAAKLADGPSALLARLDAALDAAVAAHRTKHAFLDRVARERNGPLALLSRRFGPGPLADPDTMQYRIAASGLGASPLAQAGIPWIAHGEEAAVAEVALRHLRESCARWSVASGRLITLTDADATRPHPGAGDRPPHAPRPAEAVALAGQLHPLYDAPPFFALSGESFASARNAADFIRHAFLHTPCRALLIS